MRGRPQRPPQLRRDPARLFHAEHRRGGGVDEAGALDLADVDRLVEPHDLAVGRPRVGPRPRPQSAPDPHRVEESTSTRRTRNTQINDAIGNTIEATMTNGIGSTLTIAGIDGTSGNHAVAPVSSGMPRNPGTAFAEVIHTAPLASDSITAIRKPSRQAVVDHRATAGLFDPNRRPGRLRHDLLFGAVVVALGGRLPQLAGGDVAAGGQGVERIRRGVVAPMEQRRRRRPWSRCACSDRARGRRLRPARTAPPSRGSPRPTWWRRCPVRTARRP